MRNGTKSGMHLLFSFLLMIRLVFILMILRLMGFGSFLCVQDDCRLVRNCISGFIYDSCPVDFTSDLGARLAVHPTTLKMSSPPKPFVWAANGIASSLDYVFLNRFESQRAEYWQTLYSTIIMRVPYLILCSENDDLAPYQTIHNFATRLQELGGNVKLVKWNDSPHCG